MFRLSACNKTDVEITKCHCTNPPCNSELDSCRKGIHLPSANNACDCSFSFSCQDRQKGQHLLPDAEITLSDVKESELAGNATIQSIFNKGGHNYLLLKRHLNTETRSA